MKLARIKSLTSGIFLAIFLFLSNNTFAGGPVTRISPWAFTIGGFGAIYTGYFTYKANYFDNAPTHTIIDDHVQQYSISAGAQLGIIYDFDNRYFFGFGASAQTNSDVARFSEIFTSNVSTIGAAAVLSEFAIHYNYDFFGGLGVDITSNTHFYGKIGASYAQLTQHFIPNDPAASAGISAVLSQLTRKYIWGLIVGFGLSHDFSPLVSLFAEYDYYDFGNQNLNSVNNISPPPLVAGGADHYTQNIGMDVSTIRLGLNLKFTI